MSASKQEVVDFKNNSGMIELMPLAENHHLGWVAPVLLLLLISGFYWKLVLTDQFTWLRSGGITRQVLPWFQFQVGELQQGTLPLWDPFGLRQLTGDEYQDRSPLWSLDGKQIAFHSNRGGGTSRIWTINPDGSGLQQRTRSHNRNVAYLLWSPDGSRLAYSGIGRDRSTFIIEFGKPWAEGSVETLPPFRPGEFLVGGVLMVARRPQVGGRTPFRRGIHRNLRLLLRLPPIRAFHGIRLLPPLADRRPPPRFFTFATSSRSALFPYFGGHTHSRRPPDLLRPGLDRIGCMADERGVTA